MNLLASDKCNERRLYYKFLGFFLDDKPGRHTRHENRAGRRRRFLHHPAVIKTQLFLYHLERSCLTIHLQGNGIHAVRIVGKIHRYGAASLRYLNLPLHHHSALHV